MSLAAAALGPPILAPSQMYCSCSPVPWLQRQPSLVPSCALQLGSGAQPHGGQRPGWDSGFTEHSSLSSDASEPRREPAPGGALQWQMVGAPHQAARGAAAEATPTRTELLSRPRWRQPSPSAAPAADAGAEYAGYQPAGRLGQASGHQPAQQQGDGYSQALAPGHAAANRQAGSLAARHGGQPQLQEVEVDVEVPDMPGISRAGLLNLRNKLRQQQRATLHSPAAAEAAAMSAATPSTAEPSRQPQQQQAQHFSQPLSLQQPASTKGSHLSRSPSPLQGNAASAGWGQRHRAFAGGFAADAPEENPAGSQMTQAGGFGADGTQESLAGTPGSSDLLQCATCGRTFNPRALEIHTRICNKVFASKRKAFNSAEARVGGTEAEKFADPRAGNLRWKLLQACQATGRRQELVAVPIVPVWSTGMTGAARAEWLQEWSRLPAVGASCKSMAGICIADCWADDALLLAYVLDAHMPAHQPVRWLHSYLGQAKHQHKVKQELPGRRCQQHLLSGRRWSTIARQAA